MQFVKLNEMCFKIYVDDIDDVSQLSHFYVLLWVYCTILSKCCSYKNYVKTLLFLVPHRLVEPNLLTSNSLDIYFSPCNCSEKMFVVLYSWNYSKWRCHPVTHCLYIFCYRKTCDYAKSIKMHSLDDNRYLISYHLTP